MQSEPSAEAMAAAKEMDFDSISWANEVRANIIDRHFSSLRSDLAAAREVIDAAKKRLSDLKAVHSRWYDGQDKRDLRDIIGEMEHIAYSVHLYLMGNAGPYRTSHKNGDAKDE